MLLQALERGSFRLASRTEGRSGASWAHSRSVASVKHRRRRRISAGDVIRKVDRLVEPRNPRLLVVGAGTRFLSGMSYYTLRLTNALADRFPIAILTMRQLMPTRLYPGASRVGTVTPALRYRSDVTVLPSVDWFWLPSMLKAVFGLLRWKPDVVVFQWWSGTVLHSYLLLAMLARVRGASVIVEFHEILDTAEDRILLARWYVRLVAPRFVGLASGFVIHSEVDREPLDVRYHLGRRPSAVMPHGPFDHHRDVTPVATTEGSLRVAPTEAMNILFFGVIRPFKGLEDLVTAFDGLAYDEVGGFWLTVVGETWEDCKLPIELMQRSRHRDRMTLVNRYVGDAEVDGFFSAADAVALPYRRSSASGPAHLCMSYGLPLIISAVGGLPAAVADYAGAILVPPADAAQLRDAIRQLPALRGRRFDDPHTWARSVATYDRLVAQIRATT